MVVSCNHFPSLNFYINLQEISSVGLLSPNTEIYGQIILITSLYCLLNRGGFGHIQNGGSQPFVLIQIQWLPKKGGRSNPWNLPSGSPTEQKKFLIPQIMNNVQLTATPTIYLTMIYMTNLLQLKQCFSSHCVNNLDFLWAENVYILYINGGQYPEKLFMTYNDEVHLYSGVKKRFHPALLKNVL